MIKLYRMQFKNLEFKEKGLHIMRILNRTVSLLLVFAVIASLLSLSVCAAGYTITVDGTSFNSDESKSGTGWSYNSGTKALLLDSYNGGPVISNGDIDITIGGNTVITGASSSSYSSACCGIYANGELNLVIESDASVKINGSENTYVRGGDGIVANTLYISSQSSSSLEVTGGNSESEVGGFAIKASSIILNARNLVAKGGNGASALYFASSLDVEIGTNATFVSGQKYVGAITYLSTASYNLDSNIRSVFSSDGSDVYFSTVGTFTYGDMNLDGFINAKDAVVLAQFLAEWDLGLSEASISAGDVFYDGKVNAADAVLLAQYLAAWSGVTLGK